MIDRGVVSEKLAELSDRLARVSQHRPSNVEALKADRDQRDLVAFSLMVGNQGYPRSGAQRESGRDVT